MKNKFKAGDRVRLLPEDEIRATSDARMLYQGFKNLGFSPPFLGTIIDSNTFTGLAVEWDMDNDYTHTCGRRVPSNKGYYMDPNDITSAVLPLRECAATGAKTRNGHEVAGSFYSTKYLEGLVCMPK